MDTRLPAVGKEKRRYSRVVLQRTARLRFQGNQFDEQRIRNLSLGGLFLEGQYPLTPGDPCDLELQEQGRHSSLILRFKVRVSRVETDGLGLMFTFMEQDSFMFLQTMVLYATDDPYGIAQEFFEDFSSLRLSLC